MVDVRDQRFEMVRAGKLTKEAKGKGKESKGKKGKGKGKGGSSSIGKGGKGSSKNVPTAAPFSVPDITVAPTAAPIRVPTVNDICGTSREAYIERVKE